MLLSPIKDPTGQVLGVSVINRDTTRRNEAGARLRLLESAVDNANDVIMISEAWPFEEPGPRIVYVNEAFTRMTGYTREEAIGRTPRFLQGPDTNRSQRNSIREALSKWEPIRTEMVNYRKDGTKFWVELNIVPVTNEAGYFTHWISVQRETTERRKAEEELEKSEQRFRALVRNAPDVIAILEPDNTVRYDSPAIERVLGYRSDERIGTKCRDYAHPDDVEGVKRAFVELLDKPGAIDSLEYRMRHADGSWRCVETVCGNLLDDPAVRGVVVNYRDITERRETEEKLRESHTLLRAVAEGTTDAIFVKDRRSRYLMINPAGARLLGRLAEEIIGKDDTELFSPEDGRRIMKGDRETMAAGVTNTSEDTTTAENVTRRYLTTKGPYRDHRGNVVGVFGIARDITERKRTEEALHASEARFRTVIEQSPMSIHIFAPDGHSLRANASWNALWNLGEGEEPEGANIFEDEQLRATGLLPYVEESVASLHPVDAPPLFYDPARTGREGSPRWLQASVYPVRDEAGTVIEMVLMIEDITGRKKVEEELEKSEKRFRSMVRNASDIFAILEADATVRYMSPSIERVSGYAAEELVGVNVFDYIHPGDLERVANTFAENLNSLGIATPTEFRIRHVDGSWRILEAVSNNLLDDPSIAGVVVNARDVTGRREAEEKLRKSETSLAEAQRMSNLGNWEWNVKTGEVSWSDEVYRIYGFVPREVIPTLDKLMERVHPDDRERLRRAINNSAIYEGEPYDLEHRIVRPDGAERIVHCQAEVAFDEDGEPLRMAGTIHDITGRKRAEEALRESEERFRTAFENAPIGVAFVGTEDMRYLRVNHALCEMLGYSKEELLEKTALEVTHPGDHEISASLARRALDGEFESYDLERRYLHADGHALWVLTSISVIRDSRGEPSHMVCLHQDIDKRKALEDRLEHQVLHDPLTSLANRTLLMDRLKQAMARLDRRDEPIAVLFVDLDDFKLVNDSLGHEVGDRLLVEVTGRLKECVRPEDTVARLGGDEFVILLEGISDLSGAKRVAERIVSSLEVPFCFQGHEVFVGASIGIAPAFEASGEAEDLLRNADLAMYGAKSSGKARYEFFNESMSNEALERLQLESALRRALEREEFRVYYQPKISVSTARIVSLEALVRWEHPERGLLEPAEFLPVAEKTGLIVQIGEWVLGEVCHQGREWQERFAEYSPPRVCTNVSSRQFLQTDLVGGVTGALRESGLKAQGLSLEVPEAVLMDDAEANVEKLTALKDLGVHIVIDDFGTAYSSLSYLKNFPLNFLKIDRSLIVKLGEKPEDEAIVRAMIGLAHALGWKVTAQGVEGEEQLDLLRELGCDIVQGYYFTRPVTSTEATDLLKENLPATVSP